jgi:hypothetical protein
MRLSGTGSVLPIAACVLATVASDPVGAQHRSSTRAAGNYSLKGIVTDSAGEPIRGAEVLLSVGGDVAQVVRSRADGRFEFGGLTADPVSVRVRRLGYRTPRSPVRLRPDTARSLNFVLQVMPADIDGVVVDGSTDDSKGRLDEFYEHKRQSRLGYFFERAEIERRRPVHVSELLRSLGAVHVAPAGTIGNTVRVRGCRPMVWLNGLRMPDAEVDEVAQPSDVDAVEVYVSMTGMPARLVDLVGKCGAVVIWTR